MSLPVIAVCAVVAWLAIATSSWLYIEWGIYRSRTREESAKLARATYADFVREMQSHAWERQTRHPESFLGEGDYPETQVHASIYKFDGVGMLLGPIDYWRSTRWIKRRLKQDHPVVGSWPVRL